jgi:hypothetical protein
MARGLPAGAYDEQRLLAFLEQEGLRGPVGRTHKSLVFDCPQCSKPCKVYVRHWDGRFVCWSCGEKNTFRGAPEWFLAYASGKPVAQVREYLYGSGVGAMAASLHLPWGDEEEDEELAMPIVQWPHHCVPLDDRKAARGVAYLEGRGVPASVAAEYGVHYSPVERRVFFPVRAAGFLVGWQARLVIPNEWVDEDGNTRSAPKILSSQDIPRDRVLMFQERLVRGGHAVLTEGPVDAIKCHLVGGNVCSMGKTVSRGQVDVLREAEVGRVYLGLDPDAAYETGRLVRDLSGEVEVYLLPPPEGRKDLGEASMEEVARSFASAEKVAFGRIFAYIGG